MFAYKKWFSIGGNIEGFIELIKKIVASWRYYSYFESIKSYQVLFLNSPL